MAASVRTFSDLFIASVQVFADTPFVLKDIPSTFTVSSSMFSGNFSVGDPNTKALLLFAVWHLIFVRICEKSVRMYINCCYL